MVRNKSFIESDWEREYLADSLFLAEEQMLQEKEFWENFNLEKEGKVIALQADGIKINTDDTRKFQRDIRERI